jgi:tetratricopeptide (TPR) repeat protein
MHKERSLPGDFTFPDSLQAIITARLDTLPPSLKSLLQDASVVGKVFWSGALASMTGAAHETVLEELHELTRRELVRPARASSVEGEAEFGFWHVLIRDVAYAQIPRAARAMKHRSVAEWIERRGSARTFEGAELLAYHDGQALELAKASGLRDQTPELQKRYLRSLIEAAEAAMSLDVGRAARHYGGALELVPTDDPDRAALLVRAAQSSARSSRFEEAERMYQEAIALARHSAHARLAGDALVGLASVLWHRGETARHRAALNEGIQLLEAEGPSRELTRAYAEEAFTQTVSGHLQEGVSWSNKALEMADQLGLVEVRAQSLAFRGGARGELGDLGGLDDLREALRLTRELGLARETAQVDVILSGVLWATEGPRASLEAIQAGIDAVERRGITDMAMSIRAETLRFLFDLGEWDRLLAVSKEVTVWFQAQGGGYFEVLARIVRFHTELCRGLASPLASDEFLPAAREIGDVQVLLPGLAAAALDRRAASDSVGASDLLDELDRSVEHRSDWYLLPFVPELMRLAVAIDRGSLVATWLERMRESVPQRVNCAAIGQALLAESDGRFDEAAGWFRRAATLWRERAFVFELAHALLGEGRCLTMLRRPEAAERLREASAIFEALGARPVLAEIKPWLDRALELSTSEA